MTWEIHEETDDGRHRPCHRCVAIYAAVVDETVRASGANLLLHALLAGVHPQAGGGWSVRACAKEGLPDLTAAAALVDSKDAVVALDFLVDLTFSTAIAMRGLDDVEETPEGRRTRRDLHRDSLRGLAGVTPEIDDDATWRGRGWFDDKLAIMLNGLQLRLHRR